MRSAPVWMYFRCFFRVGRQVVHGAALQQVREAQDVPQRRAQVVADGVGVRLEFLVHVAQLRGAFAHAVFQVGVQRLEFGLHALAFGDVLAGGHEVS
ncbi:hypothetical protein CTI14_35690, partial [Methylobacterium radiotolerans]